MNKQTTIEEACPLCQTTGSVLFGEDRHRSYWRCPCCGLVFVARDRLLSEADEKAEYDLHENSPRDAGYRRFLNRLLEPLCQRVSAQACGLDFGSGPGPTLSVMAGECGLTMVVYDPFYAPQTQVLRQRYDFITATEVVEHLYDPAMELERLWGMLQPGGILAIMTKLVRDPQAFSRWHYKNDPTHVRFFSRQTFHWLAQRWQARLEFVDADVMFLYKPGPENKGEL